jgi:hypothetical protein
MAKLVLRIARLERDLEHSRQLLDDAGTSTTKRRRRGKGGGGKNRGRKAGGQGRGGKKRAKRAAAAAAGLKYSGDGRELDDFEAIAYVGDHDEESRDD